MQQKSTFQFLDFIISKSLVIQRPEKTNGEFDIKIIPSGIVNTDENKFQLYLELKVADESENTIIQIEAIGFYSFEGSPETLENFLFLNAPAILFPYLRSYVSAITSLSGLDTITMPTMNLSHLQDELKSNTTYITNSDIDSIEE